MARTLVLALALFSLGCEQQPAAGPPVAQAAPAQQGATETVATIGGEPITLAEVDDKAAAALMKARQEMFDARSQTLQALINERLVEAEAKAAGVETDDFLKQKIDDKIEPVLDADIDAFYAQNQARMRGPLDAMRDQIRGYLESQRKQSLMKELIDGLRAKADVKVMLSPPRIQVAAADSPRAGSADAPIQIIEFSDFQCPYCTRGAETLDQVKEKYGDDREKQSQAMMALYKEEGVNPLGGCLPMLLQLPVFIGLFWSLQSSFELRHAPFILWMTDLSAPDQLFALPTPWGEFPVRVLPILMAGSMVLQAKLQPMSPDPAQAQMMTTIMPIMMLFLFYQFPAGLVLYYTLSNFLGIAHQRWVGRNMQLKQAT